ncbi:MAG: AMP-binding protein [Deltaproteobacteria bacterium]|nr:AMP-binding protein [Deltaproteobacteria bacterium]
MNLATILENSARYFPDKTSIIEGERTYTYSEFNNYASRIASALSGYGIRPGDHIGFCAPNSFDWLALYYGALKCGAIVITFSHLLTKNEFHRILSDCRPRVLFTTEERLPSLEDTEPHFRSDLIITEEGESSCKTLAEKGDSSFETVDRDRDEIAAILYTGGTTGRPKGAMLSHQNINASIANVVRSERSSENDLALCFLPLNHVFGQMHIMNSTIYSAGGLVILPSFNMDMSLDAIKRHKVTKFFAVPTVYIRMLELPDLKENIRSVTYCFSAAASMAAEVVKEWKARTGLNIYECYGMTESASIVTFNHYYRHVVGSVGTPSSLVEVQIRDMEGNALKRGEVGEICIRGPNIFKGYLNDPEETSRAFWGDWFRSGDIGMIDADGYLFIVDRLKDMVITGGENVYPREIEEILYTRPEVQECAVVGLPDREYGERVTAFIVLNKGETLDPAELKQFLKGQLSGYKIPKEYIAVDELPKSDAGKILKKELKKKAVV